MARQVLPIVGAVVGAFFGSPQIGYAIGAVVGNLIDPVINQGPKIGETGAQTSQEGAPRAIIYGTASCTGNIIAAGPIIKSTELESNDGGKGSEKTEVERAYRNYAIRICEGPIQAILRIWEDDKLVYDIRPGSLMLAESDKWIANKNVFFGDENQLPSAFLNLNVPPLGEHPAHRGTAYIVFGLEDLTDRRGSIPQYRFEVAGTASLTKTLNPLVVHPWVGGSNDPRNPLNEHTYSYAGTTYQSGNPQAYPITSTVQDSLGEALEDAKASWNAAVETPPALTELTLIGNSSVIGTTNTSEMYPAFPSVASQQQTLLLHFNEVEPTRYVTPAEYPIAPADMPLLSGAGPAWGASSPIGAAFYIAPTYPHGDQWTSPDRNFSTETYTNVFTSAGEEFYTRDVLIAAVRVPSPPEDFERISGTAKQLAKVQYLDNTLLQNGLGPVLLPDDPNYNNTEFWAAARAAAIEDGTLDPSVSTPVVVSEYASGYSVGVGFPVPLSGVVADIHARCNVPAVNYDVTGLDDEVAGLVLAGDYTGADAINTLRTPYFFDKCEYSKKLHYPKRGAAVVTTLTIDDLVEEPDLSKREQAVEFAKKMHLFYQHAASGYAAVKATSLRSSPDARVVGETSLQVPVVLNEDQAAQTVSKLHKVSWAEAEGEVTLSVPQSFMRLLPSDNIGLSLRGQSKRLRIEKREFAAGIINLTLRHDRQSAYTSSLTGVPIPPPTLPPSTIVGDTTLAILDIGSRVGTEDDLHYLAAGTGALPAWYGYALQRSLDGGASYVTVDRFGSSLMGSLIDDVPSASEYYTDSTNVVRVQLLRDGQTLEDLTDVQFLSEQGAFALEKADGSWEVLQYRDADPEGGGIFALTMLHRGLLNSGASAHLAGAKFVLLSRAEHIPAQSAWIGQPLTHRAASLGESPEIASPQTAIYFGRSQIEWPLASLALSRAGDVVSGVIVPRHRFGTDDAPIASANFTGYRVSIAGTSTVSFDTLAPTFSYDVAAIGGPVTVSVAALNRITGAGPATSETI